VTTLLVAQFHHAPGATARVQANLGLGRWCGAAQRFHDQTLRALVHHVALV